MSTTSYKCYAGAASIDITPPLGTRINGDFVSHFASSIHDKLYAKALALKSGNETVVLVVVDTCYMQDEFLEPIRNAATKITGIPGKNILISATHTHSAGAVADLLLASADLPYTWKLPSLIIASIVKAINNLEPALIAFGAVDAPEHITCRRYYMKDDHTSYNPITRLADKVKTNPFRAEDKIVRPVTEKMDTQLSYMGVKGKSGQWLALLANYSLHYVGDFQPGIISADYFGEFAIAARNALSAGDSFVGILTNGTSGEANIWDFQHTREYPTGDFEKSQYIAKDLADKISSSVAGLQWNEDIEIKVVYEKLYLPVNKPSRVELDKAESLLQQSDLQNITEINDNELTKIYAREQILLGSGPDSEAFTMQAIKIGSGIIGALSGEFFAETGLWLKQHSPAKNYFTICLANGCVGYVPPAHEIDRGGYETWRCRTSKLKKGAEATIKLNFLNLLGELAEP